jgi:Alg9-like mannosyltransferase family
VPFNIILYNVFSGADRGPDIFGTEPWSYYIINLFLYFNITWIAALCSFPLMVHHGTEPGLTLEIGVRYSLSKDGKFAYRIAK